MEKVRKTVTGQKGNHQLEKQAIAEKKKEGRRASGRS